MLYNYLFCIVVSTRAIAQGTSAASDNSVIIGAGVGAAVIFISILVVGGLIFISRKRQINRKKGKCMPCSNLFVKKCF